MALRLSTSGRIWSFLGLPLGVHIRVDADGYNYCATMEAANSLRALPTPSRASACKAITTDTQVSEDLVKHDTATAFEPASRTSGSSSTKSRNAHAEAKTISLTSLPTPLRALAKRA